MLKEYLKIKLERLAILIMKVVQVFLDFQHNRRYSKKCAGSNHCFPVYNNGYTVSGAKLHDVCQCKKYKFEELLRIQKKELLAKIYERQQKSKTKEIL